MLILFCIISAIAGYTFTLLMRKTARITGLLDIPKDDRRMHGIPTPVGGGVAVYLAFSVCLILYSLFGDLSLEKDVLPLVVGGLVITLVGLIDDRIGLKAWMKILGQTLCGVTMCLFGITVDKLSFLGNTVDLSWEKYPMTVIWIIAVTNIFNLIDGLDGLCTGITVISSACIVFVGIFDNIPGVCICALIFISACIGFFPHNVNPAKIFPGDAGALFFGYVMAYLTCISVYESETPTPALLPIVIFGVPVFDCFYAIIRRLANKQNIFEGDSKHIHHVLTKLYGMKKASVLLWLISLFFSGAAIVMIAGIPGEITGTALFAFGMIVLSVFFVKKTPKE